MTVIHVYLVMLINFNVILYCTTHVLHTLYIGPCDRFQIGSLALINRPPREGERERGACMKVGMMWNKVMTERATGKSQVPLQDFQTAKPT